ncbi:MAG: DNA polymerase Y family protein [Acidobacteriota bacterium]|nr:DNA polymerase Y family protein [Acidobacteriota bacterium]
MSYASIYIPDFIVQAIVRSEGALRERAVAIVDGTPPLWSVVAANPIALQMGIELGMAKSQAAQFSAVEIRHRAPAQEKTAHETLLDVSWSISPRVEDTAPDTIVLDLAGLGSLFGSEEKIAAELHSRACGFGFTPRIAVASEIEVSILTSRGLHGITLIPPGEEAKRLAALPVHTLHPSSEILETLGRWGVETCGALAALPVIQLSERLGQEGVRLHTRARGTSRRSLVLAKPSIYFHEEMELDDAVEELESLSFLLGRLLDQLCARLAARSLAAREIRMELELERSFEKGLQISAHPDEQKLIPRKYKKILTLPVPMRDSKVLLKLVRLRLQSDPPPAAIVKMILTAEPDRPRTVQGGLFLPASPEPEKLELTMARLANLVGDANVGSPELMDTHRPDGIRMSRFRLLQEVVRRKQRSASLDKTNKTIPQEKINTPANGLRLFRPEVPARVEVRDGCPARIFFQGKRGEVLAASGPWRTSGDWWHEKPWDHDEWDVELRFSRVNSSPAYSSPGHFSSTHLLSTQLSVSSGNKRVANPANQNGLYVVYFDTRQQSWFLQGMYD